MSWGQQACTDRIGYLIPFSCSPGPYRYLPIHGFTSHPHPIISRPLVRSSRHVRPNLPMDWVPASDGMKHTCTTISSFSSFLCSVHLLSYFGILAFGTELSWLGWCAGWWSEMRRTDTLGKEGTEQDGKAWSWLLARREREDLGRSEIFCCIVFCYIFFGLVIDLLNGMKDGNAIGNLYPLGWSSSFSDLCILFGSI